MPSKSFCVAILLLVFTNSSLLASSKHITDKSRDDLKGTNFNLLANGFPGDDAIYRARFKTLTINQSKSADDIYYCTSGVLNHLDSNCNGYFPEAIILADYMAPEIITWPNSAANENLREVNWELNIRPKAPFFTKTNQVVDIAFEWTRVVNLCQFQIQPNELIVSCTHPDYDALLLLYQALEGEKWNNQWDTTDCTVCEWYGIICDDRGRVKEILLKANNLAGYVPDPSFPFLTKLSLSENVVIGDTIPNFSGLPLVEEIHLNNNDHIGAVPEFEHCTHLIKLNLHNNKLGPALPTFSNLTQLNHLFLGNNLLENCYPKEWFNSMCHQLQFINFAGNPGLLPGDRQNDFEEFCAIGSDACKAAACSDDNQAPVSDTCPEDMLIILDSSQQDTSISWSAPTASDRCGLADLFFNFAPGTRFPEGIHRVNYTAIDSLGNKDSCFFNIAITKDSLVDPITSDKYLDHSNGFKFTE